MTSPELTPHELRGMGCRTYVVAAPRVVSDGERRPDGTFGIVLVSSRNAKDRHEPVSHHLGDGPAVVLYDPHQRGHARPHERVDFFRIERRRECGEPGQVREQQRDEPLLSPLGAALGSPVVTGWRGGEVLH